LIEHVPQHSDRELFWFIYAGIAGTRMPALRDTLTHEEIWHLVNYLKTLAPPHGSRKEVDPSSLLAGVQVAERHHH
jgi:mono/diheme cytochrome c family protein